jgi:hypothetical protein
MTSPISGTGGPPPQLPRAGTGGLAENTSMNFLLVGSIIAAMWVAGAAIIRGMIGKTGAVVYDGIIGL